MWDKKFIHPQKKFQLISAHNSFTNGPDVFIHYEFSTISIKNLSKLNKKRRESIKELGMKDGNGEYWRIFRNFFGV